MHILKVLEIVLNEEAKETKPYRYIVQAESWLTQWTCEGNIRMALGDTFEEALDTIRQEIKSMSFCEGAYDKADFSFIMAHEESHNGLIWAPSKTTGKTYQCVAPIYLDRKLTTPHR